MTTDAVGTEAALDTQPAGGLPQPLAVEVAQTGDPVILALGGFVIGTVALGLQLLEVVPAAASVVPVIVAASGLPLLVATFWAVRLGQTFVASVAGVFSAFWLSYAVLVLGLSHNWFAIAPEDTMASIRLFLISWLVMVGLLDLASLRLPVVYPLMISLILVAIVLLIIGYWDDTPSEGLLNAAGVFVLAGGAVGAYGYLNSGSLALGGAGLPLGNALRQ